jgi:hypothetical protein
MAALTEHYNQIQDRAGDETTGSGVRLLLFWGYEIGIALARCHSLSAFEDPL